VIIQQGDFLFSFFGPLAWLSIYIYIYIYISHCWQFNIQPFFSNFHLFDLKFLFHYSFFVFFTMNHILNLNDLLYDSPSDDELEIISTIAMAKERFHSERGSISCRDSGRSHNTLCRNSLQGQENLFCDYFAASPVYPANKFWRRFRMRRELFIYIHNAIVDHEPYFVQKRNAIGKLGHSSLQKMTAALRMLVYGVTADLIDEYLRIGEATTIDSFKLFVQAVNSKFSAKYLRSPTQDDIARLLAICESCGFSGMLGSIDCMHWKWKNYPNAWKGMYSDHIYEPIIILEAVTSYDLWI
jgi:hypothetical protein